MARLLDGGTTIDGLVVDTDLRWSCFAASSCSARQVPEIDSEQRLDDTAAGRLNAAACRAAIPTAAAKAAA